MFGLSLDDKENQTIVPPTRLELGPSQIVFVTGVSGGGKSTLLRLIAESLADIKGHETSGLPALVQMHTMPKLEEVALVDALAHPEREGDKSMPAASLETVCRWLSLAGLNDAAVMLRRPGELSEGQRHRLRLAQALAITERRDEPWSILLADEFGSSLDRPTAHALARCVRRRVSRCRTCLVAATAHDDLLEPLAPDVLVEVAPGGQCAVHTRNA